MQNISANILSLPSGQFIINPEPECFGHFRIRIPLLKLPFGVTSADVVINCPDTILPPKKKQKKTSGPNGVRAKVPTKGHDETEKAHHSCTSEVGFFLLLGPRDSCVFGSNTQKIPIRKQTKIWMDLGIFETTRCCKTCGQIWKSEFWDLVHYSRALKNVIHMSYIYIYVMHAWKCMHIWKCLMCLILVFSFLNWSRPSMFQVFFRVGKMVVPKLEISLNWRVLPSGKLT